MKKGRVLIVDDEVLVREVLYDILEQEGYNVTAVDSAASALKEARQRTFDLLISDLMLPEINGLELVRRMRELSPETVPILITAHPSLETVGAAIPQGVHNYIVKPFNKAELCMAVENALATRERDIQENKQQVTLKEVTPKETVQPRRQHTENVGIATTVVQNLRNCELFETLSNHELQKVAAISREHIFAAGENVYRQGERAQKLFVIGDGCVSLQRSVEEGHGEQTTIDVAEHGAVIGWTTLIEPRVHMASAVCLKRTKVLAIDGAELRCILDQEPSAGFEVMKRLAKLLYSRLRAHHGEGKSISKAGKTEVETKGEDAALDESAFGATSEAMPSNSNLRKLPVVPRHAARQDISDKPADTTNTSQTRLNL